MKVLVTGAYGQLGKELECLSDKYPNWTFLFTDVDTLDITDETEVNNYFQENKPSFIVNCAAYTAVDKAESDQKMAMKINGEAPGILAKASKKIGAQIIHVSTDYVFNGRAFIPYSETDITEPNSVYGRTKLHGEERCQSENANSIIIRTSWLYSAFGNNFVKTMMRLGKERESVKVIYDQIGTPTNAEDLAGAILSIIEKVTNKPDNYQPGIYHYSNEGVASWYDFAKAVFEFSEINCEVIPVLTHEFVTAANRPNYSVLNKSKIKNTFGIKIPFWRDSLHFCIKNRLTK